MSTNKINLNNDHNAIIYLRRKDKRLSKVFDMVGPISYTTNDDYYAFLIHEIIEQMLSVKVANRLYERFEQLCSNTVTPDKVSTLTFDELKSIGISANKVRAIQSLTTSITSNNLDLSQLATVSSNQVMQQLTSIKGIGTWTAKMFLIFCLDHPDILPYEDAAFLQSYKWLYKTDDTDPAAVKSKCKKWHPYTSIAARYMYKALDLGLTKEEFHLYKQL